MKFLERALLFLSLIGYYLAVWRRPADYSVLFISAAGFALLYLLGMPFLLRRPGEPLVTGKRYYWLDLPVTLLFGIIAAYCVFSIVYHSLGKMTSLAIVENCGLFLLLIAIAAAVRLRKTGIPVYRSMLLRCAVLAGFILCSLLLRQLHPALTSAS